MSATATIRPFTVVAFDIDGNPHVFPVSAHDERSAELKLSLQDKEEFGPGMIVAVLPGELEMNPPEASTELEAWTVVGFWSDEPFQFVTDAYSAAEALITCWEDYERAHGLDERDNLPLLSAGAFRGSYPQVTPSPEHPGPRSRLSSLAGRRV